ncbi:MAG: hypothetical protein WCC60_20745 [Ilumatobacteraceae bacterium]
MADGLITISLLGSLFFSVSLEASRDRILLYLLLAVAPLAVIAPVAGPILERARAGYRSIMVGSLLSRAIAGVLLAGSLKSPTFYPLVFVVLLSRKAYALARTALLPHLVPEADQLADASGHLSRVGTVTGGIGTAVGGAALTLFGAEVVPVLAAFAFVATAVAAHGIPAVSVRAEVHSASIRTKVPHSVRRAGIAVCGMRASNGALAYLLALAIKRGGIGSWIFVVALVAAGFGSYLGTAITGALHRRLGADQVVAFVLLLPGSVTLLSVLAAGDLGIVAVAFSIGLGSSVATRTMDALYGQVPDIARGRAISYNELLFQLCNVTGAVLAVMLDPTPKVGFLAVSAVLLISGVSYASQRKLSLRHSAGALLLGRLQYSPSTLLPRTLLDEATLQGQQGASRLAIVTAHAAVRSALAQGALSPPERWQQLQALAEAVLAGEPPSAGLVDDMLAAARSVVGQLETAATTIPRRE